MTSSLMKALEAPYTAYAYSYPHKTAYRSFEEPIRIEAAWKNVDKSALFLYFHIPFCEMRCGFCNLFTTAHPQDEMQQRYMDALELQANSVRAALGECQFARMAVGGGTPTFLDADQLERLFHITETIFGIDTTQVPISVETSPRTATREKLLVLSNHNVERISIGVQSFVDSEVTAVGRSQREQEVSDALNLINELNFPILNIDLIYGLAEQSKDSWIYSLETALKYDPREIYIYPLYVRPLTGLGKRAGTWHDERRDLYDVACHLLKSHGYSQSSMRMFQHESVQAKSGPDYCCQTDGMIGIGAGARSYTQQLHYSSHYAVGNEAVRSIIDDYTRCSAIDFSEANYGFQLDLEEQKHRFVIQSLLQASGLDLNAFHDRFDVDALSELPQLTELIENGLAHIEQRFVVLTEEGVALSDAISYELYSSPVKQLMAEYTSI